jgi:DNA-binding NarL/FixJ family response regulator
MPPRTDPRSPAADGEDPTRVLAAPAADVPGGRPRIILVDDDADRLERLREAVDGIAGVVVAATTSGQHALELSAILGPDVALVDLDMPAPGIGGAVTAQLLRRHVPAVSVIVLSDTAYALGGADLRRIGASAQVSKDAPPSTLHEAILHASRAPRARTG